MLIMVAVLLWAVTETQAQKQRPDAEQRAERMTSALKEHLELPENTWIQVKDIYKSFFTEINTLRSGTEGRPDRSQIQKLREDRDVKLKAILSEEQFSKLREAEQSIRRERMKQGRRGGRAGQ